MNNYVGTVLKSFKTVPIIILIEIKCKGWKFNRCISNFR